MIIYNLSQYYKVSWKLKKLNTVNDKGFEAENFHNLLGLLIMLGNFCGLLIKNGMILCTETSRKYFNSLR